MFHHCCVTALSRRQTAFILNAVWRVENKCVKHQICGRPLKSNTAFKPHSWVSLQPWPPESVTSSLLDWSKQAATLPEHRGMQARSASRATVWKMVRTATVVTVRSGKGHRTDGEKFNNSRVCKCLEMFYWTYTRQFRRLMNVAGCTIFV